MLLNESLCGLPSIRIDEPVGIPVRVPIPIELLNWLLVSGDWVH